MGTSTKWGGPRWGSVLGASRRALRFIERGLIPPPRGGEVEVLRRDWVANQGDRWLTRLHRDLKEDPDAYGLRSRAAVMGRGFVLAFAELRGRADHTDRLVLVGEFATRVAGTGTGVVDAVGRRAAVRAGERLLGPNGEALFCLIYREFFADLVAEFLRAMIAEELRAAVPALVLLDPSGQISDWVAGYLVELVPDPCAAAGPTRSVLEVAIEKVPEAVDVVLGLRGQE